MTEIIKRGLLVAGACAVLALSACADRGMHVKAPENAMPILDMQTVAGTWDGLMKRRPRTRGDDYVTVTIGQDGTYQFTSTRISGVFGGTGILQLLDGKLKLDSERAHATFTLYARNGEQILMVEGLDTTNDYEYRAELTRAR